MGSVLVHIDILDGERPDPSSMAALAAGRAVASSWGATLYAALIAYDPAERTAPDETAKVVAAARIPGLAAIQSELGRAGADKVVVAVTDTPIVPLWAVLGGPWQGVLDQLRPRLVLFGADAPSAAELGPRTGARTGARLLLRARATPGDQVELRDRDGGTVRASDGGAAVALIGAAAPGLGRGDEDVDLMMVIAPGGADPRVELTGTAPAELAHARTPLVALGDDVAGDAEIVRGARRLARLLGAQLVGGPAAAKASAVADDDVVERGAALAPALCVTIGAPTFDLAGATPVVRIGGTTSKAEGAALPAPAGASLDELLRVLERP